MNLNKDLSEYEHLVNSSGKVVVFMKLAELVSQDWWVEGNILNTSVDSNCDCPRTWVRLTKQIQETVIAVFEDYFHRNNWLPQSISVANDAVCILKLKNHLPEMIEFLNTIMENFLHVEWSYDHSIAINGCESDDHSQSEWEEEEGGLDEFLEEHTLVYRIDSQDDIYAIDELPTDEIQQSSLSTHATDLPKMLPLFGQHLQFLNIQWDNELDENSDLSLGDDVLPVLQILQINLFGLPPLRQLCDILLTSKFASSLSFIQIPQPPPPTNSESSEEDFHVLDDALGQLPDCVRIEISQEYWEHLPKSKSRGVFKA
ncbi:hypothetical protein ABKN59_009694 [Abortiporus biennis]